MKKLLAIGLVSFSLSMSLAEARFFVGIEGGYDLNAYNFMAFDNGKLGHVSWGNALFKKGATGTTHGLFAGINLGTEYHENIFGWRWFLGLNYGQLVDSRLTKIYPLKYMQLQLGADALFNVAQLDYLSFGAFIGLSSSLSVGDYNGGKADLPIPLADLGFLGRIGLYLSIGEHNKIEIATHIPIMQILLARDVTAPYNPLRFTLGYKYIF